MNTGLPGKIFSAMQADIIRGVYPIGARLPAERELSRAYGASRFAVREAIAMLAQSGLVETHPQSGTYVRDFNRRGTLETLVQVLRIRRSIDRETLDSLLRFRFVTETEAAREAALRATEHELALLKANLERKQAHLEDIAVLAECDFEFHYTVIEISGNVINRLVFHSFRPIYSFFTEFFYSLPGVPAASLRLNARLLGALSRRDPEAARRAMGAILKHGERKVYDAVRDGESVVIP
ncbi:MAG: FadR family transcriptional regulator [Spirochaetes bacterium]|jgi:GntR family transcriptional repressor for pyruvate dehydrogenase complex|nr:FadR family transcriptional regulator [Spirochaetota bacterium]